MAYNDERPGTLHLMYDMRRVDELKRLGEHLKMVYYETGFGTRGVEISSLASRLPTRKADLVEWIVKLAHDDAFLKYYYERMNSLEQAALQEVVHSEESALDTSRFEAKYGGLPRTYSSGRSHGRKEEGFAALAFWLTERGQMPLDFQSRLRKWVPTPKELEAALQAELPEEVEVYRGREKTPLVQQNTEQAALEDVMAVLQLVGMGKVGVGAKTGKISQVGADAIRRVLSHGDYYPEGADPGDSFDVQLGPLGIRPFAWTLLLQAGNLAQAAGSKLELTRTGRAALNRAPQETLSILWERWLKNKLLHELNRVEVIKGQKSAKHPLYAAEPGRRQIALALSELEEGKWVRTDDFFDFLIAGGHKFDVVRNDWVLYISDPQYGSLGYSHVGWEHTNGRFARAFLLEYAATLGLIDLALVPPWGAVQDIGDLWGADNLSCLSRYDGLWALRLNSLGAWILGQKKSYSPSFHDQPSLQVLPNLEIAMMSSAIPSSDALFLDRISEKVSERVWRLSFSKLLQAVEEGVDIHRVIAFIEERSRGGLPQPVRGFFDDVISRTGKIRDRGEARLIECADAPLAQLIANDSYLRNLCFLAGDRYLAVPRENEPAFRKGLRELGYVLS